MIYLFPSFGNVLRGSILSYLWCLVLPHVVVFIVTMIGSEISRSNQAGIIVGSSLMGTALLFILTLFLAFAPLITAMILNGSGIAQAGGIIGTAGANFIANLPRQTLNNSASFLTGKTVGPKTELIKRSVGGTYKLQKNARKLGGNYFKNKKPNLSKNNLSQNNKGEKNGAISNDNTKNRQSKKTDSNNRTNRTFRTSSYRSRSNRIK